MANIRWGGQRLQRDTTLIGAPAPAQFYLGANVMDSNGYYSVEQPFLDILKQAGSNYGYTPWWTRNAGGTDTLEEAPFSLLCDDFNYPTTLNLGMPPIKWSPGLWGLTYQNPWTATSYQSDLAGLASAGSAWKGYMVYATWNLFENATLGTYNWTLMDNTIAACAAQNLQFMIQLNLGTFNKSASQANLPQGTGSDLLPEYILKGSTYGAANMGSSGFTPVSPALYGYYVGPLTGGPGCYWANFTNANVMARIQALANAMGARYNSNPNFYGVILCAWDTQSPNPGTGITDAQYFGTQSTPAVQGRELILSYFKTAMPNCNVCEMTGYEGPGQSPTTPQNHAQWCVQNAFPLSCSDTAPATGWNANYESIAGFTANGNSFSSIGGGGTTGTLNGTTWTTPSGSYLLEFISTSQIVTATLVDGGSTCTFSPAVTGSPNLANTQVKMAIMPTRLNVGMYSWFGMPYPGSTWTPPSAGMRSYCSFFATVEGGDFSNAGMSPIWSSSTNAGAAADILNAGNQYYDASHVFMSILYNSDYTLPASNGATFTNIYPSLNAIGVSANAYPSVYPSGQEFTYVETWMNINIIADTPVPGAAGTYPAAYSPITYGLTFSGACTLNLFGASSLASASPNISIAGTQITSTMTAGQSALVTFTMSTTGGLRLQVLNLPSNSNYFRNASIVDQAYAANYASGSILHPLFKSSLTGAGLGFGLERLRFMGGLNTNFEDYNLTFSATLASGATSGTLTNVNNGTSTTAWPLPTGTYQVVFATGQSIPVSFTYNATACSWATPLSGSITTSAPGCMACASGYIWESRPLPGSVGYNTLPLEVVIQSCNEISSDCWLNIPATAAVADATFLSNLASLCYNGSGANTSSWNVSAFAGLAVNQKLYIEYSNETAGAWNGGAGYAQGANFLVMMSNAVTPNLYTANGSSRGYGSAEWYGVEVATIAQQFSSTYGLAFTKRVVPTLMCQFALGNGIGFLEAGMNTTHWTYRAYTKGIAAIGWAPYCPLADSFTNMSDLGNLFGLSASAQLNEIFSLAYTNVGASGYTYAGFRTDGWIGDALGASNGCAGMIAGYAGQPWASLPIHCYELGVDMAIIASIPPSYQAQVQQLLTNVARDARMSYVYSDLGHVLSATKTGYLPGLNTLSITGNQLDWVHPTTEAINSGGWGIFELITQMASVPPSSSVPRYQGLLNYINGTQSAYTKTPNITALPNASSAVAPWSSFLALTGGKSGWGINAPYTDNTGTVLRRLTNRSSQLGGLNYYMEYAEGGPRISQPLGSGQYWFVFRYTPTAGNANNYVGKYQLGSGIVVGSMFELPVQAGGNLGVCFSMLPGEGNIIYMCDGSTDQIYRYDCNAQTYAPNAIFNGINASVHCGTNSPGWLQVSWDGTRLVGQANWDNPTAVFQIMTQTGVVYSYSGSSTSTIIRTGITVTSATSNTVTVTGAGWNTTPGNGQWDGATLTMTSGAASGQSITINSNTASVLSLAGSFTHIPSGGDQFTIYNVNEPHMMKGSTYNVVFLEDNNSACSLPYAWFPATGNCTAAVGITNSQYGGHSDAGDSNLYSKNPNGTFNVINEFTPGTAPATDGAAWTGTQTDYWGTTALNEPDGNAGHWCSAYQQQGAGTNEWILRDSFGESYNDTTAASWSLYSGSIYQTSINFGNSGESGRGIIGVLNWNGTVGQGSQITGNLTQAASLAAMTAGTFFWSSPTLYVWLSAGGSPAGKVILSCNALQTARIGFYKQDGSQIRDLCWIYFEPQDVHQFYSYQVYANISPDGLWAVFISDLGTYDGFYDLISAEVPTT